MKKLLYISYLLGILLTGKNSWSQVAINFNPAIHGQSLEGLSFVQLSNSYPQDAYCRVTIKIREMQAGNVVSMSTPLFLLRRGNNIIDRTAFSQSRFAFGNNRHGLTLNQSGRFLEGEYEYCFEVDLSESKIPGVAPYFENCFMHDLQPFTPLLLINPVDGDENCNTRPHFIWQPPMPMPADGRFRLVLVELKEKQDIIEAINFNIPIINQANIPVNQLAYPNSTPELKAGKKYAWQVILYSDVTILKKSEVWTYTVKCEEEKQQPSTDSYREMKENQESNFYVANKIVRFSFHNPYNGGDLNYSIASLTNPSVTIKNLPKLSLQPGLNKYDVDLTENRDFRNGQEYELTVRLVNGRKLMIRFIYKNE